MKSCKLQKIIIKTFFYPFFFSQPLTELIPKLDIYINPTGAEEQTEEVCVDIIRLH